MKKVYCAKCGTCLAITRRALPKHAKIIDIVEYHECLDTPINLDLEPVPEIYPPKMEGKQLFVEKLNEIDPPKASFGIDTGTLRDRRFEPDAKSSAPTNLLNQVKNLVNSIPAHELKDRDE